MTPQAAIARVRRRSIVAWVAMTAVSVAAAVWSADIATDHMRSALFDVQQQQRDSSVAGCTRTRADREDAIRGWSAALKARRATAADPKVEQNQRLDAADAAATYKITISGLRSRLVDCQAAFPPPKR